MVEDMSTKDRSRYDNKTSRVRTARRPPVGRPLRVYIIDEYAENQRNVPSRRRGKIIGTCNLSESYQHGAIGGAR